MKYKVTSLLVVLSILVAVCGVCTSAAVDRSAAEIQAASSQSVIAQPLAASDIVYITRTGSKYHKGTCSYLRRSKIQTTRRAAEKKGYTACSVCRP